MENRYEITPVKKSQTKYLTVPPSPFMQKLGYGTGVAVYRLCRTPVKNIKQSPWAVKKLIKVKKNSLDLKTRLCNEANLLRQLDHPNVVGFRAIMQDNKGVPCLAMEDCSKSLGDLIELREENENLPFPAKNIHKVASDIAKALNYLHNDALILHCDIKSFNVLVKDQFLICKLCDFGVCLPLNNFGNLDITKTCKDVAYVGTLSWNSPEVLQCDPVITSKADIYAYGLVLWEMLALSPPPLPDDNDFDDDDGDDSFDNKENLQTSAIRIRPDLPDFELNEDYNGILEIYYCCTEVNYKLRPTAIDLCTVLKQTCNKL